MLAEKTYLVIYRAGWETSQRLDAIQQLGILTARLILCELIYTSDLHTLIAKATTSRYGRS